mmetsp:Transcript_46007/g.80869  ORF Transcript_46007/g.80869 Transcript_46007/m.80869 type:complete len:220 (-) Transcript_46007:93-752(-)
MAFALQAFMKDQDQSGGQFEVCTRKGQIKNTRLLPSEIEAIRKQRCDALAATPRGRKILAAQEEHVLARYSPKASPRLQSSLVCPGRGLVEELQQPLKVRSVGLCLSKLDEDRRRHFVHAAAVQMGVEKLMTVVEDIMPPLNGEEGRGVHVITHHALDSPAASDEERLQMENFTDDQCADKVLEELIQLAAAKGMDTPASAAASRVSTAPGGNRPRGLQ